ncbi:MAG: hypothetical protein AB7O49_11890 [Sphingomonadales bacterium]
MHIHRILKTAVAATAASVIFAGTALALSPEEKLAQYQPTGKKESCLDTYQIRETDVIDNQNVLFRTSGNTYYINHLPNRCSGLKMQDGFSYTLRGLNKLCSVDVITPVQTGGAIHGPCPLGEFEEVTKVGKPTQ